MAKSIKYIIYQEGNYYVSQCLNFDVSSFGNSVEESRNNLMEAITLYLEDNSETQDFITIGDLVMGEKYLEI